MSHKVIHNLGSLPNQGGSKMKEAMGAVGLIEPKREYNATEIRKLRLIPWAKTDRTIAKVLESGAIKARITGEITQKRYLVEGAELIKYLTIYGPVLLPTVRQHKHGRKRKHEREIRSEREEDRA